MCFSLFLLLSTTKTLGIAFKTSWRKLWNTERKRQIGYGPEEPRNKTVVTSLDFLFASYRSDLGPEERATREHQQAQTKSPMKPHSLSLKGQPFYFSQLPQKQTHTENRMVPPQGYNEAPACTRARTPARPERQRRLRGGPELSSLPAGSKPVPHWVRRNNMEVQIPPLSSSKQDTPWPLELTENEWETWTPTLTWLSRRDLSKICFF